MVYRAQMQSHGKEWGGYPMGEKEAFHVENFSLHDNI